MGEAAEVAGRRGRRQGLIERLAELETGLPSARAGLGALATVSGLGRFFALGLVAGLLVGGAGYGALLATAATSSALHDGPALPHLERAGVEPAPPSLDLAVARTGHWSRVPLLVTGLAKPGEAYIILRNLPEAAWFSHGERRDEHTWALATADLDELQLTLRDAVPEAFTVGIEVVDGNAAVVAETTAQVHLFGAPAIADAAPAAVADPLAKPERVAVAARPKTEIAQHDWRTGTLTRQFVAREALPKAPLAAAPPDPAKSGAGPAPPPLPRPDGMSALGAISHEPTTGRWLWWKLPSPLQLAFTPRSEPGR